ncbi:MAG: HAD family hydrolase [Solirubrobacteraceae bacterium]
MIEALLLDFDGLLYDTETAEYQSWNELYVRYGQHLALDLWVRETIGRPPGTTGFDPAGRLERLAGVTLEPDAVIRARQEGKRERLPDHLMPGADALLAAAGARGLRTAIVSSNFRVNVLEHLARAGCSFGFDALVTADGDPDRGKPNPTLYLEALARLALEPAQAVAFEDSPAGIAAAKAAGLWCVAVPNQITRGAPGLEAADQMLSSLVEVALDQLTG